MAVYFFCQSTEVGATLLDWSPQILLLGGLFHSLGHSSAVNRDFNNNYLGLKEKQLNLSKARQRELQLENDFFKQDVQNREDLALLKDPVKDLPEEVVEKMEDLHSEDID